MSALVGLIGHSGAGKSACLRALGISLELADMDDALGTDAKPTLPLVKGWLFRAPVVVAWSIHGPDWREWFREAKSTGVLLIYLRKCKKELEQHLKQAMTCGKKRPDKDQKFTIGTYDQLDLIFKEFKDHEIDCSGKSAMAVAEEVKSFMRSAGLA
jgi:hypothetical protein